jgi:glycosyltransferase involved in cell wall biosynthesis
MVSVSCIVPVYDEEAAGDVVAALGRVLRGRDFEIIVVDDGSLKPADYPGASVVRHPANMGYGAAIKSGLMRARGERVLIIDADGTYPPESVPRLLEGDYDMVVGSRPPGSANIPLHRRAAKWVLGALANYLSGTRIPDLNSGLRVFRRAQAMEFLHLYPRGFSFTTTITLAFLCSDYTVKYVPIEYRPRRGRSKIRPVHDGISFIALIVRTILYFNPLKVFLPLACGIMALSFAVFAYSAFVAHRVMDITVVSLIVTAVEVALVGLLADLVVKRSR